MAETKQDLTVDLPSEGDDVAVEVDESGASEVEAVAEDSEEHEAYSKKVQKRIDKLTHKVREAERQQDAAIEYAKTVQVENSQLKDRVQNLDKGYVAEYGDRIATQSESLEKDLETAIATNDTAAQVELNKKLARLAIEEERVAAAKQQQVQYQQQMAQQAATPQQVSQTPSRPDPKAESWASKNDWFGDDEAMTFAAFGIHKKLVEEEGFDTESPAYYDEIDKRIRDAFPHKFNGGTTVSVSDGRKPQQAVASATRSSSTGRKTVRLSPSEVAIANKLGVPLDEYAKQKTLGGSNG
jgi:hypothetical protein|tara:strand:+ start:100 stop:990 length:891 start_codon:yes stop_codon:yes gene_type:complete